MISRLATLFVLVFALALALTACSAPQAELLDGPIVEELREGMTSGGAQFDHSRYEALLRQHVDVERGVVDYAGLKAQEAQLDAYLQRLAAADLTTLDREAQLALLINAYNAYTFKLIVEHYPGIGSIRDISDPWTTARYEVGGHTLSLDQIEHNLIRPLYKDPRIHFVVNCAARSCPHLADFAFTGPKLEEQLEARTEAILSHQAFVRVEGGKLRYTRVMDWYAQDFVDKSFKSHAPNVARYIARYTTNEVQSFITSHDGDPPTSPLDYDWSLNDAR